MIISCKCGKYQFTIKKSDMPNNGREVQCGICNEIWFHGLGSQNNKLSINKSFKNPFLYQLIIYMLKNIYENLLLDKIFIGMEM